MPSLPDRGPDSFPDTRWSLVQAGDRGTALEHLAAAYWRPIFGYVRARWARDEAEALDATQDFFVHLAEGDLLRRADPLRGRFRGYVRAALANGALAQEGMEAGARSLAAGDAAGALRAIDGATKHLTRALHTADADPALLAARGVCALLSEEALGVLARIEESAAAREAAARDFAAASRLDGGEVRVAAWWNQGLLDERRARLALAAGDARAASVAQDEADAARSRARAGAVPGSALASLLVEGAAPLRR